MKKNTCLNRLSIFLILPAFLVTCACNTTRHATNGVQQTPLDLNKVISAIQVQYDEAIKEIDQLKKNPSKRFVLEMESASVSLEVTSVSAENASISIPIVKPSLTNTATKMSSITFNLEATNELKPRFLSEKKPDFSLASLIVSAAKEFNDLDPKPIKGLTKQDFDITVEFSLERDLNGDVSFKLFGLGADAGYEYDHSVQHELHMTFKILKK